MIPTTRRARNDAARDHRTSGVGRMSVSQDQSTVTPSAPAAPPTAAPGAAVVSVPRSHFERLAIPLLAVIVALGFVALATSRWNSWVGGAAIQTTDDAYVRAELTKLSSRVAGEVLTVAVKDF